MKKDKKYEDLQQQLGELTADLQRIRADFENYRKRTETEKLQARESAASAMALKLLPVIDNIDRALHHLPDDLKDNNWAKSVVALQKNLDASMQAIGIKRIKAANGTPFDPTLHEAISMEDGEGETEVVAEELQPGYLLHDSVLRHSLVKVTYVNELKEAKKEEK